METGFNPLPQSLLSGPALGMFGVFVRTGPPITGGHHLVSCQEIPDSTWAWTGFHSATHCNAGLQPDAFLRAYNAANSTGELTAVPQVL